MGLTGYSERLSSFLEREKEEDKRQNKYLWTSLTINHKTTQIPMPFVFKKNHLFMKKVRNLQWEYARKPLAAVYRVFKSLISVSQRKTSISDICSVSDW